MGGPNFHAMFVCHKWVSNWQVYPPSTFRMYNTKEGFGVGVGEAFASGVINENSKNTMKF
jgi:hypothetical protein